MDRSVLENFVSAVRHKSSKQVPVVIYTRGAFLPKYVGVNPREYFQNMEVQLKAQLSFQKEFPETMLWPGFMPDFGLTVEASAFGSEIIWGHKDDPPFVKPAFNIRDIVHIRGINPEKDGSMPKLLKGYQYLWKNLDKTYIEDFGYLDGFAYIVGPIETAGLVLGYDGLFLAFYDFPDLIHKLLSIISDSLILFLKAQERINGRLKRIHVTDHVPTSTSTSHFEEFCFPYLSKIFKEFPSAIKLYHNEGNITRILSRMDDLGADIFHFGVDISEAKRTIGDKVCLMGNLHPVNLLLKGTPQQILQECKRCIKIGAPGGGYLLSTAGGLAPGTPKENVETMVKSVK